MRRVSHTPPARPDTYPDNTHLRDRPLVGAGTTVATGQPFGFLGASGNADGGTPHLHLGIGPQILTGGGPTGGAGSDDYDAVGLLRRVYACCVRR